MYFFNLSQPSKSLPEKTNKVLFPTKNINSLPNSKSNKTPNFELISLTKANCPKNKSSPIESRPTPQSKATFHAPKKPTLSSEKLRTLTDNKKDTNSCQAKPLS
jgi:hypothetical protein